MSMLVKVFLYNLLIFAIVLVSIFIAQIVHKGIKAEDLFGVIIFFVFYTLHTLILILIVTLIDYLLLVYFRISRNWVFISQVTFSIIVSIWIIMEVTSESFKYFFSFFIPLYMLFLFYKYKKISSITKS
jgi:hypothetical protein